MIVGFTGSRNGLTSLQKSSLKELLTKLNLVEKGHHGDCLGADVEFHDVCLEMKIPIVLHPPSNDKNRAFCQGYIAKHPEAPYLERDRDIVDAVNLIIATPAGPERLRSGTWTTVRYARKKNKAIIIIESDGNLLLERFSWEN